MVGETGAGVGNKIREVLEGHILKGLLDHINEFQLKEQFLCAISEVLKTLNQNNKNNSLPCSLMPSCTAPLPSTRRINAGVGCQH